MLWFNLAAGVAAATSGFVATRLTLAASRRLPHLGLRQRLTAFCHMLLSPDQEDRLVQEYLRLWPVVLRFTARNLLLACLSLAPVALAFGGMTLLTEPLAAGPAGAVLPERNASTDWQSVFFVTVCVVSAATWLGNRWKA